MIYIHEFLAVNNEEKAPRRLKSSFDWIQSAGNIFFSFHIHVYDLRAIENIRFSSQMQLVGTKTTFDAIKTDFECGKKIDFEFLQKNCFEGCNCIRKMATKFLFANHIFVNILIKSQENLKIIFLIILLVYFLYNSSKH